MAKRLFTDTARTLPAVFGDDVAGIAPLTEGVWSGAQIPWTQASASLRPKAARQPVTGVRNIYNGHSEDLNAAGSLTRMSVGASLNVATTEGPDTLQLLIPSPDNDTHKYRIIPSFGSLDGTGSFYLKGDGSGYQVALNLQNPGGGTHRVRFDPDTGTFTNELTDGTTVVTMTDVGDGVYRCRVSGTFTEADAFYFDFDARNENGDSTFAGDGVSGVYVGGMQAEAGLGLTAYQRRLSDYDITETGVASISCIEQDGVTDQLSMVIPNGIDGSVAYCSPDTGIWIEDGVTVAPGGTLQSGAINGAGGTRNLIPALGRRFWSIIPLDGTRANDAAILNARARVLGVPGVLKAGGELLTNSGFDADLSGWIDGSVGTGTATWSGGAAVLSAVDAANKGRLSQTLSSAPAGIYLINIDATDSPIGYFVLANPPLIIIVGPSSSARTAMFEHGGGDLEIRIDAGSTVGDATINSVSVKKLTAGA